MVLNIVTEYNLQTLVQHHTCEGRIAYNSQHVAILPILDAASTSVIDEFYTQIALGDENVAGL